MKDNNPFGVPLGLFAFGAIIFALALVIVYPVVMAFNYMEAPGQLEKIEALRRDVRYYQQIEKCIPASVVADVQNYNHFIVSNRNPGKFRDPAIPNTWNNVNPIEIPQDTKLCN